MWCALLKFEIDRWGAVSKQIVGSKYYCLVIILSALRVACGEHTACAPSGGLVGRGAQRVADRPGDAPPGT